MSQVFLGISYWCQINKIIIIKPESILEIGIRSGFVSKYLKERKVNVLTLDIDKRLNPDVVGSVLNVFMPFARKFFKILSKFSIVAYIEQKRTKDGHPLPEFEIKRGFLPFRFINNKDFFQSEKFFDKRILETIKIKEKYIKGAEKILQDIPKDSQKVFIHIRRGDYINEIFMGQKGINLPKKYYLKAISLLQNEIKIHFIFFFLTIQNM
jgi:hypothetical protein